MKNKIFAFALLALFISSCKNKKERQAEEVKEEASEKRTPAPDFNADSAYIFIEQQVKFGPRVPGTIAHAKCADFLSNKLKSYGLEVTVQSGYVKTYDGKSFDLKNIIASSKPESNKRILLCAHWDTRHIADRDIKDKSKPIEGANDGGSGVGVLLEIARSIQKEQPDLGIDILLFDLEDYGQPEESKFPDMPNSWALGSQYWAKNPHKPGYFAKYGILLDMVGAKDAVFAYEGNSMQYAPELVKKVWNTARSLNYGKYFIDKYTNAITDDHVAINQLLFIPTIDIVHHNPKTGDFGTFHHTHNDNMSIIDKNTLKAVGQTVLEVIYSEPG